MKFALHALSANAATIACIGVAGYLAAHSLAGWGWFLILAAFCVTTISYKEKS